MQFYDIHRKQITPTYQQKSIGVKHQLIPKKVIKWVYREGTGNYPNPGENVWCVVGCSLIDGTDIVIARDTNVSKYLIGRGQLIKGLELALSQTKKDEIFKLFITSEFAYQDNPQIKMIPPNSSLIFEITVLTIVQTPTQKKNQTQIFYEIYHKLQLAQNQMYKCNPKLQTMSQHCQKAIQYLILAYDLTQRVKYYRSSIRPKIVLKIVNFFVKVNKIKQALYYLQQNQKVFTTQQYRVSFLKAKIQIFRSQQMLKDSKLIQQMEQMYIKNQSMPLRYKFQQISIFLKGYFDQIGHDVKKKVKQEKKSSRRD